MYNKPLKNYKAVKIPYWSQQNVSNLHSSKAFHTYCLAPVCILSVRIIGHPAGLGELLGSEEKMHMLELGAESSL